jgi:hypothetical protein
MTISESGRYYTFVSWVSKEKTINGNEGSRPVKYNKSRESTSNFDTSHKQVHNIDSDGDLHG